MWYLRDGLGCNTEHMPRRHTHLPHTTSGQHAATVLTMPSSCCRTLYFAHRTRYATTRLPHPPCAARVPDATLAWHVPSCPGVAAPTVLDTASVPPSPHSDSSTIPGAAYFTRAWRHARSPSPPEPPTYAPHRPRLRHHFTSRMPVIRLTAEDFNSDSDSPSL